MQDKRQPTLLHLSKYVVIHPTVDAEGKETGGVEMRVQKKGTTYRNPERALRKSDPKEYFKQRRKVQHG